MKWGFWGDPSALAEKSGKLTAMNSSNLSTPVDGILLTPSDINNLI